MAKFKPVQVKICGITNASDALWVVNLGGDYVGLNFCPESPRKVIESKAGEIIQGLPPFVKAVGVFMNMPLADLQKVLRKAPLAILQLHGDESPAEVRAIKAATGLKVWKAVRMEDESSLEKAASYAQVADALLLDAYKVGQAGGTGETFDWELAIKVKQFNAPIYLAGGLKPDNVVGAIQTVEPVGVDTASGVEKDGHPRKKDLDKLKVFIQRAKGLMK